MPDIDSLLAANRAALDDFVAAAERCEGVWTTPRAPGKWSPSQLAEHVALAIEEGGNVVSERPTKLPTFPAFVRPVGGWLFRRILRKGGFPKTKTNAPMNPDSGPATLDEARQRLNGALEGFERDCRERAAAGGGFTSGAFGRLDVTDYARFIELHTRHHTKQMVPPTS